MTTRERQIADVLLADATMVSLLPGGIYTSQEIGVEGIRRGEDSPTNAAFDENGYLLGCAVVRQRDVNSYGANLRSHKDKLNIIGQMVEVYYYEYRGHDIIEPAKARAYQVLEGLRLEDSYPLMWSYETTHVYDVGPVMNSSTLRQDWLVVSIRMAE